jgi:hypothetical protein
MVRCDECTRRNDDEKDSACRKCNEIRGMADTNYFQPMVKYKFKYKLNKRYDWVPRKCERCGGVYK